MKNEAGYPKNILIYIGITACLAFFINLGSFQLLFEEPRRALVALEMMLSKNYWVPTTNGYLYYNKPPLYNWVLIPFLKLFGTAEWVVRLPNLLSLFATAFIHYRISRKYIDERAAILSALFYLCSADILFFFSFIGEIDLFYALLVHVQVLLIFHFHQKGQIHWLYLSSYLLTAAGCLTKGIPSLAFQALTLLLIFVLNKEYKRLFSVWHFAGIALLTVLCGGYFYIYSQYHDPAPYLARLFTETFSRSSMENTWLTNLKHLLIGFPVMLIKLCAPWVLFLPLVFKKEFRNTLQGSPFLKFCFWFVVVNAAVYWLSPGTRERYLYMFLPPIFSLLAVALVQYLKMKWAGVFYIFIASAVALGLSGLGTFAITRSWYGVAAACIVLAILLIAIAVKQWQNKHVLSLVPYSILFVFVLRIGFDLAILPTRRQGEPYRETAKKVAQITGQKPLYLNGPPELKADEVKFAGKHIASFIREEPVSIGFQNSYYLSAFTKQVVKYSKTTEHKGYYITPGGWSPGGLEPVGQFRYDSGKSKGHLYDLYLNP